MYTVQGGWFLYKKYIGNLKDYLWGAVIAFGIVLVTSELLSFFSVFSVVHDILNSYNHYFNIFVILHVIGGFIGGYYVTLKKENNIYKIGIYIGIAAFSIEYLYFQILVWSVPQIVPARWALLCYIIGSISGSYLSRKSKKE